MFINVKVRTKLHINGTGEYQIFMKKLLYIFKLMTPFKKAAVFYLYFRFTNKKFLLDFQITISLCVNYRILIFINSHKSILLRLTDFKDVVKWGKENVRK